MPILRCGVAFFLFILVALGSKFGCAIALVSGLATKAAIVLSIFSFTKHSLLIHCYKLMLLLFNFDLFLNLGFYYI